MSAIRSRGRRGYTGVPNWRWEDPELDAFERCVAGWLASHADGFIEEHVTGNEIARRTGFSRDKVQKALKKLEGLGIIELTYGEPRHRLVITFDWAAWENPPAVTRPVTGCHTAGDRLPHSQTTDLHLSMSETQGEEQTDAWFDDFWLIYPRHTDKKEARKSFARALKTDSLDEIIDGAARWARFWEADKTEERYIPHPPTWLNRKRWEAQCPKPRPGTKSERSMAAIERLAARGQQPVPSLADAFREIEP